MFEIITRTTNRSINVSNSLKETPKNTSLDLNNFDFFKRVFVCFIIILPTMGHFSSGCLVMKKSACLDAQANSFFSSLPLSCCLFYIYFKQNIILQNENQALKKNISALIKTARVEINRKDEEISHLHQRYKQTVELKTCFQSNHIYIVIRNLCACFKKN